MSETPWWHPARHADRRPALIERNRIRDGLRAHLVAQDFVEVDPAALQVSPGNEAHLHALATDLTGNEGIARRRYLHTSPEFAMKKLLAAGERRIFSLGHVWRNRERGPLHTPEFTLLEWYRAGGDTGALMDDIAAFCRIAAPGGILQHRGRSCDITLPFRRLPVADAFLEFAGIDLLATIGTDGATDARALAAQMDARGIGRMEGEDWSDLFSRILSGLVEPHLGQERLCMLDLYPAPEAALARREPSDPRLARRFEAYACGVELANGFDELTDATELRRRFEAEMALKEARYGERYPIDEDFLAALAFMPAAAGCAMGFDRLVMLATGAARIDDILWVPAAGE
mgnify:CR=1 FL=1